MTDLTTEAATAGRILTNEKPLNEQQSATDNVKNEAEPQQNSPYDAKLSEEDAAPEKKSQGGLGNYFVSTAYDRACRIDLMLIANFPICGPSRLCVIRDCNGRCCCFWR